MKLFRKVWCLVYFGWRGGENVQGNFFSRVTKSHSWGLCWQIVTIDTTAPTAISDELLTHCLRHAYRNSTSIIFFWRAVSTHHPTWLAGTSISCNQEVTDPETSGAVVKLFRELRPRVTNEQLTSFQRLVCVCQKLECKCMTFSADFGLPEIKATIEPSDHFSILKTRQSAAPWAASLKSWINPGFCGMCLPSLGLG